jgi:signal transduction histidine kinase
VNRTRGVGPFGIVRRILDARRGDVRAMEDLYHLRSVLTFVAIFAATIGAPGLLLAYYGIVGIRADELASAAALQHQAEVAATNLRGKVEAEFQTFEDHTNNRLKTGQSVYDGLAELSDALRVVYRFNEDGDLTAPLAESDVMPGEDQVFFWYTPYREAVAAEVAGVVPDQRTEDVVRSFTRAAALYAVAARDVPDDRDRATLLYYRARALQGAGDLAKAEALYRDLEAHHPNVRELNGFRLGDLCRLKLGEIESVRSPAEGKRQLRELVEDLVQGTWRIGRGAEPAVALRALDMLSGVAPGEWIARMRGTIEERSSQLYWAGQLWDELRSLGAKGRLFRSEPGKFSYHRTDTALWALTWTEQEQYAFGLELPVILSRVRDLAATVGGSSDIQLELVPPDGGSREGQLDRQSLAPWLSGWSVAVYPRDPERLAQQRADERLRGLGIIGLSVLMILVGAGLSASLVQRELEAARDKSDFAAHVSHELRSPITQIRLKAEALQLGLATDEASRTKHYDVIMREAERLSRLVDNVLDFAAIERGRKKYTFRLGDLGATVQRAVESAQVAMEMRGMEIDLVLPEDLPPVWHDPDAVSQVLTNLLSNAAKYGKDAGWVGVSLRVTDTHVEVDVADRGIGIAGDEQRHIFEQYYRANDPKARRHKGTGIGLTIVKYIMEAHSGRIGVRSGPGEGSVFTLQFPLKAPAAVAERAGA